MRMPRRAFEKLVARALETVPGEFRPYLDGLPVVVEDEPPRELLEEMGVPRDETLLGVFLGPALEEELLEPGLLPGRIVVYRLPHLEEARNLRELEREVVRTILHEVAHRFGISEERLEELGLD